MVVLILNYNNNNKFLFFKKNLKQTILLFVLGSYIIFSYKVIFLAFNTYKIVLVLLFIAFLALHTPLPVGSVSAVILCSAPHLHTG